MPQFQVVRIMPIFRKCLDFNYKLVFFRAWRRRFEVVTPLEWQFEDKAMQKLS